MKNLCNGIYLDNAATTRYKPRAVYKAIQFHLKYAANPGRSGHCDALQAAEAIETARDEVRKIAGDGHVIFTKNCTEALNVVLFGLKLRGEVITTVFDHNSVLRPLYKMSSDGMIQLKFVKPFGNTITSKEVSKLITKDTSLIVMSEMSNLTGAMHEAEEIAKKAHEAGIKIVLDTAQSMGHSNTDYSIFDAVCSSGHKGLHGPQGTGFLRFHDGLKIAPLLYGGTGIMGLNAAQPETLPEGLESGTLNTPGIAGLCEGIRWTVKHKEKIRKKTETLSRLMIDGLHEIKNVTVYTDNLNGVIAFNIKGTPSTDVSQKLDTDYGISVRSGLHCAPLAHRHIGTLQQGAVRASLGWNNNESDVKVFLRAVAELSSKV